ncbi:MAG TPA: A24 family peptidase [Terricaulis sp.]|nr:A24 family peptidase [Terricaulis sp.]HRP10023.1 A24 family peptidase [Terricaulis sp.]
MLDLYVATFVFAGLLLAAALIDIRTMRIPNALNAMIALAGLFATWRLGFSMLDAVIGAAAGYAALFLLNWLYRALRGRDGLGLGDAKLLAGVGAWLGWMGLPFVVLIASALGVAFVAALRIAGRHMSGGDALAFGPFLCIGALIVWIVLRF